MIKNLDKKLKKYCAGRCARPGIQVPFYQGGKIRATDSYIAVSIAGDNNGYVEQETPQLDAIKRPTGKTVTLSVKLLKSALSIFNDKVTDNIYLTIGDEFDPVMMYQKTTSAEVLIMPIRE